MPTTPLMIRLDREAEQLLRQWAPNGKRLGGVIERLVYSERDRRELREQMRQRVMAALHEDDHDAA